MAFSNFIPQIWNASLLLEFRARATAAALTNRQYEGDARTGNQVKITSAVDISVKDYKAASRTTTADSIDVTQIQLLIDQEKNFDFLVDDIDRAQAAGGLDAYNTSAATSLALDADAFIFDTAVNGVNPSNIGGTSVADAKAAFNGLRDMRKRLNKFHVPLDQRVAFINSEYASLLLDYDSKLTAVDTSGDGAGLREATIGRLLGFRVVETENMPGDPDDPKAIAWYSPSVAFVSQVTESEAMRDTGSFSDRIRGLHVYGSKVLRGGKGVAIVGEFGQS